MEFDIESARLAILCETGKVVTRSGKLINITRVLSDEIYPLAGNIDGQLGLLYWTIEGKYFADERESPLDLFIDTIFDV